RLRGQMIVEALVLAVIGGAAGVVVAWAVLPALVASLPANMPRVDAIHINGWALSFVVAVVVGLGLLMGAMPLITAHENVAEQLRSVRRLATGGRHRVRSGLVVAEVALAVMLLIGAGLVGRSMIRL